MAATLPTSVVPDVAEAPRSTLAGTVAVAEHLPVSLGAEVLETARHAFAQSFDVTAVVTAGVVLITAALVTVVLRGDASECENRHGCAGRRGRVRWLTRIPRRD
jgi:DHA2 family multidrug resistance protein-like MFS transporter